MGSSDVNVQTSRGGDSTRRLPLIRAAMRGDWETAKSFLFHEDKEEATSLIISNANKALNSAILTGKANDFVKKLVEFMSPDAVAVKNKWGNTALNDAAMVGNTEAAIALVTRNPDLLYSKNNDNRMPVLQAAGYGHKDTLVYLISKSNQDSPFEGQLGIRLLNTVITSEFLDVALDLVTKYPNLARLRYGGQSALSTIAAIKTAFPSRESFSWWQHLIYRRVPLKQSKHDGQATSVAGDIENVSSDGPAQKKNSSSFQLICGVAQKLESMIWDVVKYLVPQVKDIRNKKVTHQQALEHVNHLCEEMVSLPENEAEAMFRESIIIATEHGISEIVELILDIFPMGTSSYYDKNDRHIFLLAASYRFENIMNLLSNMSDRKYLLFKTDKQGNNLMHMCGKLASPDRLNLVPGAALQMQRELQWFKGMEKFVQPSERIQPNKEDKTAKDLFTEQHRQLKAEGERWMKDTANACTIAAALIATVVFAAAFTVPGGVASETGIPIFSNQFAFVLFAISDAVSLFTSITSLLMFLSILTSRYAEEDFLYVLPERLSIGLLSLFISIIFMMAAFSATLYLVFSRKMAWFLIPVVAFACLPVTSFVLLQFPLLVDVIYSTYGPGIFGKKSDRVLY